MKKFKTIDCWLSVLLIAGVLIYGLAWEPIGIFYGYFVVGGWHCVSIIIHAAMHWFDAKGSGRRLYHLVVLGLAIITLAGTVFNPIMAVVAWSLLFAAPFMAVYYTWLCFHERYSKMQRPMALLK